MSALKRLTTEEKNFYEKNGFIKLSGIFTEAEMDKISEEYNDLFALKSQENENALKAKWAREKLKQEGTIDYRVRSIHNLQMHSAEFTKVITNPKLLDAVEDILGTEDILLHHTKAHMKPPEKGAPFPMHQNYPHFPFKNHTVIAVFLHLDDTTPEIGGLVVYPGSHKLGPLEDKGITDIQEKFPLSGAIPVTAKKGDLTIFSYLLLHGACQNLSDRTRRMFVIHVRAADDEPIKICHQSPAENLVLRGKNVRRPADMASRFVS